MHTRQHHELAFAHQQHAQMHRYHADAHHQQAMFHQQQATFHQNQLTNQGTYNEKTTAFNNQVSPAALIYQGHVSPQAMQSLNQFSNPYQQSNPNMPVSPRTAHTTDNQNAWNRGTQF